MSVYPFETHLRRLKSSWQEVKIESLGTQLQLLDALITRNRLWASRADRNEIKKLHLEIADLFQAIIERYKSILYLHKQSDD